MKKVFFAKRSLTNEKRLLPVLRFLVALFLAALAGTFLFDHSVIDGLVAGIISVGLDPLRSQFIAALLMTAASALIGAALGRRKLGALLGAALVFYIVYLSGFIQLQLQPVLDPGGHLEPLNSAALFHTSLIMLAMGLLSAFIGAAIGAALGDVLLDPPYQLLRFIWQRFFSKRPRVNTEEQTAPLPEIPRQTSISLAMRWLAAAAVVAMLVLASASGDLFLFSPDVGLHTPPHLGNQPATPGAIISDSLLSPSLGNQRRPFLVYLPPSYKTDAARTKRYPTLYLLHGVPGKDIDWITGGKASESADTLIATDQIPEALMILPDGNGRPGAPSEWANSYDQKQLMETFVASDLVKYVDQHYRTIPDPAHRALAGLSMGGFGAMNIAVHHPDIFGSIISLGGYYQAEGPIWGKNKSYMQLNSPASTIPYTEQAWKLHIYLGAATKDQPYYKDTLQFAHELDTLHIHYQLDVEPGYHSWRVWQKQFYNALKWLQWGEGKP